jgi:hypothetical protein
MTPEQRAYDIGRGRTDIAFWAWRFLGIRGNPGQLRFWQACTQRDPGGWLPLYLTLVVSAGNRAGKTLAVMVVILHHAFYKMGIRPPDITNDDDCLRWLRVPYEWYHVAIQQEIAEIVHREVSSVLRGEHPSQEGRGCPLIKEFGPIVDVNTKDRGEYMMLSFSPKVGGSRIHFRSTQDKAKALLGKDMNGISFDEAGKEMYLMELYQEVFNFRRLSTGGPLLFIGTPFTGLGEYYDLWELGNPTNPNRNPQFLSLRLSTRDNIGYGINQEAFDAIVSQAETYLIPQNVDGEFIEAPDSYFYSPTVEAMFDGDIPCKDHPQSLGDCPACHVGLPQEQRAITGHRYSQGVDPGIEVDATWAIVLDYTSPKNITGVYVRSSGGKQSIPSVVNMVQSGHYLYGLTASCVTTHDSGGMGGQMWLREFREAIPGVRKFDFGGTAAKKEKLLSDLKTVIDNGTLKLPKEGHLWLELRKQLLAYKRDDHKITQDAVMALAIAVYHAVRNSGEPAKSNTFRYFGG